MNLIIKFPFIGTFILSLFKKKRAGKIWPQNEFAAKEIY